ncbi:hypothetical protein E4U55_005873 [Claviceps digitariae]|nr:hypothetical protein E4U55_005873 [Claviceps digitariae]
MDEENRERGREDGDAVIQYHASNAEVTAWSVRGSRAKKSARTKWWARIGESFEGRAESDEDSTTRVVVQRTNYEGGVRTQLAEMVDVEVHERER